jgi:phosphoglycolate phosphatase-like HAD superfamily hydrolase
MESYLSEEVRKTDLTRLKAVPVLFHSGYLTIDKVANAVVTNPVTGEEGVVDSNFFRLPNFEVSNSYLKDCFNVVFGSLSVKELEFKREALEKAFLARDAGTVGAVIEGFLSKVTYHQNAGDERTFHSHVQLILTVMGFDAKSEEPGAAGRLDLHVELPDRVHVIIELKYRQARDELSPEEENEVLASLMLSTLEKEVLDQVLADAAKKRMGRAEVFRLISRSDDERERNRSLAEAALESLPGAAINEALAEAARQRLTRRAVKAALREAKPGKSKPSKAEIDRLLPASAQEALNDMVKRDYHSIISSDSKEIVDLGLAVYGHGHHVKAAFGNISGSLPGPDPDEGEKPPKRANPRKGRTKAKGGRPSGAGSRGE